MFIIYNIAQGKIYIQVREERICILLYYYSIVLDSVSLFLDIAVDVDVVVEVVICFDIQSS